MTGTKGEPEIFSDRVLRDLFGVERLDADRARAELGSLSRTAEDATQVVATMAHLARDLRTSLGDRPDPAAPALTGLSDSLEADHDYVIGMDLIRTGQESGPLPFLERAVATDPGFNMAHESLGDAYYNIGRMADSTREYRLAARPGPVSKRAELAIASNLASMLGDYQGAIGALEDILKRWPEETTASMQLSETFAIAHEPRRALEVVSKRAVSLPTPQTLANLEYYNLLVGDFESAVRIGQDLLRRSPHHPSVTEAALGSALVILGRRDEAIAVYQGIEQASPARAARGLADLAVSEGRLAEAGAILDRVADAGLVGADGSRALEWGLRAETELRRGHRARALDAAEKAGASHEPWARYMAASVFAGAGEPRLARSLADEAGAVGPDAALLPKLASALALRAERRSPEALAALQGALAAGDAWLVHLELARTYLDLGDREAARRELRICDARKGEGALAFLGDDATLRYVADASALQAIADQATDVAHAPGAQALPRH